MRIKFKWIPDDDRRLKTRPVIDEFEGSIEEWEEINKQNILTLKTEREVEKEWKIIEIL